MDCAPDQHKSNSACAHTPSGLATYHQVEALAPGLTGTARIHALAMVPVVTMPGNVSSKDGMRGARGHG
eukprot:scaffold211544_cov32-Tisochrysis_lutea.AAC.2